VTFGAVTAQVGAVTAPYGENFSWERIVASLKGSSAIAKFSAEAPFKAAVTKIVSWLETAGSGPSIASPGASANIRTRFRRGS